MHPVPSTNIAAVGYDKATKTLRIEFSTGKAYSYLDVPETTYLSLRSAPSAGRYFAAAIKNVFSYEPEN
jgi:hypothetical protein